MEREVPNESLLPSLADGHALFGGAEVFDMLAGDRLGGYNGCIELCDRWCGEGRVALRHIAADGSLSELGFDELQLRAARIANMLVGLGIRPGDRVAGLLPRTPDFVAVLLGTLRVGAVYQPLFTAFGPKAIETRLAGSGAKLVITDQANRGKIEGSIVPVLVTDLSRGTESLAERLQGLPSDFSPAMIGAQDPFLMMFTSGTTGSPKGLLVPIEMLRATWAYMRFGIDLRDDDIYWNMADIGWAYGLYYGVIGPLLLGVAATLVCSPFSVEATFEGIRRLGVTNLAGAPTAYRQMAASGIMPPAGMRAISSAGEPLDGETKTWLTAAFACPARDHYGQTELGMFICDHHGLEQPDCPGAIGFAMPGFRVAVVDDSGQVCPPDVAGTIAVDRSSPLFWFGGYDAREEQPFVNGYYVTGDTAVKAHDGSFRFVGREDDVITSSGYRIGPFEVEGALMEHPAIVEAAVIGRPDPARTEIVMAFVRLAAGQSPSAALASEIQLFVKRRLAAHSYPREIVFVEDLPKTPSGKIQRFLLREREIARLAGK